MKIISDLHLHSKYSRACSKHLDIANLEKWAKVKGLNLLGTSDFTHPKWIKELKANLTDDGTGILKSKGGMNFLLQSEVSLIYTDMGKGRRVHNIILAPNFDTVDQITKFFLSKGRIDYDGRPIFKVSCPELVEEMRSISKDIEVIPAHCLIPNSLIQTNKKMNEIKNIKKGDQVVTHKGRYRKVEDIYKRKYDGQIIEIIPACMKIGTYFTPEHPILSIKSYKECKNMSHTICKPTCAYLKRRCNKKEFERYKPVWTQAKNIEKGDIALYPRYNQIKDIKNIKISDNINCSFFKEKGYIKPRKERSFLKNLLIKNEIKVSEDFCRLIGYYLAEGHSTRDHISFTFSKEEIEYIKDVEQLLINLFGPFINIIVKDEINSNGISLSVHSKILCEFFKLFYVDSPRRSYNKQIPSWFLNLPENKLKQLLIGWWRGDAGYTSSIELFNQFKTIMLKIGIIPSISKTTAKSVNKRRNLKLNIINDRRIKANKDIYHFTNLSFFNDNLGLLDLPEFKIFKAKIDRRKGWLDENYVYLPVIKINKKQYNGLVYNLEVKEDHSYITENLAVHNCWTPWFGLLGSNGGFDSVEEGFKDQARHIHALETGLSSDPPMNWRLSKLDKYALVSNSDSHSFWPWRIGREATLFNLKELTYDNILKAIRTKQGLNGTIEVDPAYGKYHWDGHRNCDVCMSPKESLKHNKICPKCGKPITIGVEFRVEELADRKEGFKPTDGKDFYKLIPISDIISKVLGVGVATKKVWTEYNKLIAAFGNEIHILLKATKEELLKVVDERIVEIIMKNRVGQIYVKPGFDGEYGVPVFDGKPIKQEVKEYEVVQKGINDFF